jgi:hypothetical protein
MVVSLGPGGAVLLDVVKQRLEAEEEPEIRALIAQLVGNFAENGPPAPAGAAPAEPVIADPAGAGPPLAG